MFNPRLSVNWYKTSMESWNVTCDTHVQSQALSMESWNVTCDTQQMVCVPFLLNLTARSKGESPALLRISTLQLFCRSLLMVNVLPGTQCWQE